MPKEYSPIKRTEARTSLIFLFLLGLLVALGLLSWIQTGKINQASTEIEINWLPSARLLGKINFITVEYRLTEMEHVL